MTFYFSLPPDELAAALTRLLSQSHDGLRFKTGASHQIKFLYPPRRVVARGDCVRGTQGGSLLRVTVPLPTHRLLIHAPLGLVVAGIGWWRPDNPLGTGPVAVGLAIFALSVGGGLMAVQRVRERLKAVLSHHTLKPAAAVAALGLEA